MNTRITQIRKSENLTQEQFGQKMGISKNYVNLIENGKKMPGSRLISDICQEFNIREEWLRSGKEPIKNNNVEFGEICREIGINDPKAKEAIMKYYELSEKDKQLWWGWMERFMK